MILVNLVPVRVARRGLGPWVGILGVLLHLAVLGGLGGWSWSLARTQNRLAAGVDRGSREIAAARSELARRASVLEELAGLTRRLQALQELTRHQHVAPRVLDALVDVIPRDVWLTSLEGHGLAVRARGAAPSAAAVAALLASLQASGRFGDVDVVISKQDPGQVGDPLVSFEVSCRFGG